MSAPVFVRGLGVVSPAGWGLACLGSAASGLGASSISSWQGMPGVGVMEGVFRVPPLAERPAWMQQARLRRVSPISQFAVGAVLEALGAEVEVVRAGALRLGLIACTVCGSVQYTRRFLEEVRREPGKASPMLFPETVFNAPASHVAAVLGARGESVTLVGDRVVWVQGLGVASDWLREGRVDRVVVVGLEEADWILSAATAVLPGCGPLAEGAGAICLGLVPGEGGFGGVTLGRMVSGVVRGRGRAVSLLRREVLAGLGPSDGRFEAPDMDRWLGDGLAAGVAWRGIVGLERLRLAGAGVKGMRLVVEGGNAMVAGVDFDVGLRA